MLINTSDLIKYKSLYPLGGEDMIYHIEDTKHEQSRRITMHRN